MKRGRGALWGVAMLLLALAGCHRARPRPVPYTSGYVRLDVLMKTHPEWKSVEQIDFLIAQARAMPSATAQQAFALPVGQMPPALKPVPAAPPPNAPSPSQVVAPALERVDSMRSRMVERNKRVVQRQSGAVKTDIDAEIVAYRNKLLARQGEDETSVQKSQEHRLLGLQLQVIALQSQLKVLAGRPWGPNVQADLNAVQKQIDAINAETPGLLDAVRKRYAADLEAFRKEREAYMARWVAQRENQLNTETERTIAGYKTTISQSVASLPPIETLSAPQTTGVSQPPLPAPARAAAAAAPQTQASASASVGGAIGKLQAQRDRMTDFIARDMRRRIERVAQLHHWQIIYTPAPGVPDVTDVMRDLVSQDWTP